MGVGGISRVGVDVKEIVKRFFLKTELQRTIVTVITNYTNKTFLSNQKPNMKHFAAVCDCTFTLCKNVKHDTDVKGTRNEP